ncbi:hypothetical protein ACN38_g4669 [Penicillium nordicum]|uniref:Uncharacterized protein n=1 Tax=Penicillium nordicum TaxID=229535 RepID=A0A0M8PA50_9EURO|nr:hypothetical protein ACN38_g4669 [Penicillium nordicum]
MSARTQAKSKLISRGPLDPNEARWARMIKTTYTDPLGVERTWESAERTVRVIPPCYVLIPLCCKPLVHARGICITPGAGIQVTRPRNCHEGHLRDSLRSSLI